MQLLKLKSELKNELLIEAGLVFVVYLYVICAFTCCLSNFMKYECAKAVVHSKTYIAVEKDACIPSKPLNGVCLGVVYTYKNKEVTSHVQVDQDKFKIGDTIHLCVENADPTMVSVENKKDYVKLIYLLLLSVLLATLASIKLSLWSVKPKSFSMYLSSIIALGIVLMVVKSFMSK